MSTKTIAVDLSNPEFTGYLTKRSAWLMSWRKRYFVLKGDKLYFSKSPKEAPHGVIDLTKCRQVRSAYEKCKKKHSLEVSTDSETYFMYANSEKEKDEWIGAIGKAIVHSSMKGYDSD